MCLHGTGLCVSSQLSSFPDLGGVFYYFFWLFFPPGDALKSVNVSAQRRGKWCMSRMEKYVSPKKNVNFLKKTMKGMSLLTVAQKTDVSSCFSKRKEKKTRQSDIF